MPKFPELLRHRNQEKALRHRSLFRWHPTQGLQFWSLLNGCWRNSFIPRPREITNTSWVETWAEPEYEP